MARLFTMTTSAFDEQWPAVERSLRDWYAAETALSFDAAVERAARRYDEAAEPEEGEGTIWDGMPELDSKRVVEALSMIEPMLDETVPVDVIKPGGYASADEFVEDMHVKLRAKCRNEIGSAAGPSTVPPQAQT
jgi:hypothetical protein